MDCFASLAMTWIGPGVLDTPHAWHDRPVKYGSN
jgi:hypothetical protein